MMKREIIWHDGAKERPEKNGEYIVITKGGFKMELDYAEGYWNAHIDHQGVLQKENAMDSIKWWAKFPEPPMIWESDR